MPNIDQISNLFKALAHRDLETAEQIAGQIAAEEERKGHHTASQRLRGALAPNGKVALDRETAVATSAPALLAGALYPRLLPIHLRDVALHHDTRAQLLEIITEFQQATFLKSRGIRRRSKIIFVGPPGCGKSLTAHALARALKLPLYIVRFDSVIGAYLGQTATHLRQLFDFAETNECVLLFDEIDALGKRRGHPTEVGELDRIVIALMQELELSEVRGLLIATSNLPENLDAALWRRFDLQIRFPAPNRREVAQFVRAKAKALGVGLSKKLTMHASNLKSYADIEKLIEDEARRVALRGIS
jgi:SpoVK/Ycf46/Vps4 family AAA+-type ATPase